jgi:hypothetical protein
LFSNSGFGCLAHPPPRWLRSMNVGGIPAAKTVRSLRRRMRSAVILEWTGPKSARLSALAMTVNSRHTFAPRDAMRPSRAFIFRPKRGRGECRVPTAPAASRALCVGRERTRVTTSTPERPAFPHAMVLTVSFVLSSVTGLFCHRRLRIWFCPRPVGPT